MGSETPAPEGAMLYFPLVYRQWKEIEAKLVEAETVLYFPLVFREADGAGGKRLAPRDTAAGIPLPPVMGVLKGELQVGRLGR